MTTTSARALSLQHAIALAVAAAIAAGTAGACRAATHPPAFASETGWQDELVNRPGCWSEGEYDHRDACEAAGRR